MPSKMTPRKKLVPLTLVQIRTGKKVVEMDSDERKEHKAEQARNRRPKKDLVPLTLVQMETGKRVNQMSTEELLKHRAELAQIRRRKEAELKEQQVSSDGTLDSGDAAKRKPVFEDEVEDVSVPNPDAISKTPQAAQGIDKENLVPPCDMTPVAKVRPCDMSPESKKAYNCMRSKKCYWKKKQKEQTAQDVNKKKPRDMTPGEKKEHRRMQGKKSYWKKKQEKALEAEEKALQLAQEEKEQHVSSDGTLHSRDAAAKRKLVFEDDEVEDVSVSTTTTTKKRRIEKPTMEEQCPVAVPSGPTRKKTKTKKSPIVDSSQEDSHTTKPSAKGVNNNQLQQPDMEWIDDSEPQALLPQAATSMPTVAQAVATCKPSTASASDGNDTTATTTAKSPPTAIIHQWLDKALPELSDQDRTHYASCLAEDGFDTLELLTKYMVPEEDLGFMKKAHRRAITMTYF